VMRPILFGTSTGDLPRGRQIPMPLTSSVGHPKRDLYVNVADVRENDDSVRGSVTC
jgi:hypothetical protein